MPKTLWRVLATVAAVVIIVVSHLGSIDEAGKRYAEAGLKRALIAYGVARGLNGVISVAQGTEVAVEPVGVGVTFKPGEILDPINDLVERFSWIVLVSGTSLGIQRVLLDVAAYPWFAVVVSVSMLASVWVGWRPRTLTPGVRRFVRKATVALVIVRFAIPLVAIASESLYDVFLEPQYSASTKRLEETADTIKRANDEQQLSRPPRQESILDSAKRVYRATLDAVDVEDRIAVLKDAASDAGEYTIDLIVVFVLETILFPLLFLWLTVQLLKRVTASSS